VVTTEQSARRPFSSKANLIQAIVSPDQVPAHGYEIHDFGDAGNSSRPIRFPLHINDPVVPTGRASKPQPEPAAAGGYTMLVDMPLKLPASDNQRGCA